MMSSFACRHTNDSDDTKAADSHWAYDLAFIEILNLASAPVFLGSTNITIAISGKEFKFGCSSGTVPSGGSVVYFASEGQLCSEVFPQTLKLDAVEAGTEISVSVQMGNTLQKSASISFNTSYTLADKNIVSFCQGPGGGSFSQKVQLCDYPTPGLVNTLPKSVADSFLPVSVLDKLVLPEEKKTNTSIVPKPPTVVSVFLFFSPLF